MCDAKRLARMPEITIDRQSKKTMENGASNHQNVSTPAKNLSLMPKNPPTPIKMSAEEERFQPFVLDQETKSDYEVRITLDAAEKNKNVKMGSSEIGVSTQGLSRAMEENKDFKPCSSDLGFSTHKLAADFRNAGTWKSMKTASGEVSKTTDYVSGSISSHVASISSLSSSSVSALPRNSAKIASSIDGSSTFISLERFRVATSRFEYVTATANLKQSIQTSDRQLPIASTLDHPKSSSSVLFHPPLWLSIANSSACVFLQIKKSSCVSKKKNEDVEALMFSEPLGLMN